MEKTRFRFTVVPAFLALLVGWLAMPALGVVRVDARGMGHEHLQKNTPDGYLSSVKRAAISALDSLASGLGVTRRHALFSGAAMAALVGLAIVDVRFLAGAVVFGMAAVSEGRHAGGAFAGERWGIGASSRENITVLSGQNLSSGAVVGRVNKGIGSVSIPTVAGGTGTGTVSAVFAGPDVEVGSYVLTLTAVAAHGGVFSLTTPSGKVLPVLTMTPGSGGSTVYTSSHLNFTITDATDFIIGNSFTFVVGTTAPTVIGGTGTGTISALSLGPDAKTGNYRVINRAVVANGGDFEVIAPDGSSVGRFLMGTSSTGSAAFASRQINFTLTDATDFILGNYFDVAVYNQLAAGKVVAWDPTTFDGRDDAAGVLFDNYDASAGDKAGVIMARDGVVVKSELVFGAAITTAQKETAYRQLEQLGIIAR